jgi:MFS family permease
MPFTNETIAASIIVGIACAKTGRYRWALWSGWAFCVLGFGVLILLDPGTTIVRWVFINFPVSIGTGMLFPAMGLAIQAAGRPQDSGHSAAFFSFMRVVGNSLGVAIGGVAFQNQIKKKLLAYPLLAPMAEIYSKDATGLVAIIKAMQEGTEKTQLIKAYADSLKIIWIVMCALSGVALIASLVTKAYTLNQEHTTLQGFDAKKPIEDLEAKDSE